MAAKWRHALIGIMLAAVFPLFPAHCFAGEKGLARQVLAEINLARRNPRGYAGFLKEFRGQFRGSSYCLPGREAMVRTVEGVRAIDEAIRFLSLQKSLPPLAWRSGLAAAAAELVEDEGASGATGHNGPSCGGPEERIARHAELSGAMGEAIFYGPGDARHVVMNLIIDDGVPGRGHRKNIYSPDFARAGVACGPHMRFEAACVIDFAGGSTRQRP